jgi:hypothetical protein
MTAFNVSKAIMQKKCVNLSSTDSTGNLWRGNQIVLRRDIDRKTQFEKLKCPLDPKPVNTATAGILRTFRYVPEKAHKGSTPMILTLFSDETVKAYHVAAATGRLVVNFDGSG